MPTEDISVLRAEWTKALQDLPATPGNIPAIFLAHGQPMIAWPKDGPEPSGRMSKMWQWAGPDGPLAQFLDALGPVLLAKYKPKGIVVLSAHWETEGERLVTDYGDENPLLMDYYGFIPELYKLQFHSKGSSELTERVLAAFKTAEIPARSTPRSEPRGRDGRGFTGPGLDHGVFVPFLRMFGKDGPQIPIVQVSIDESLDPVKNWDIGRALAGLRSEGYLIISGGLNIHSFENGMKEFGPRTASSSTKDFDVAVTAAASVTSPEERRKELLGLVKHPGFRAAHPREEHFIPIYVAAGAGSEGSSRVLSTIFGQQTFAFF